MIPDRQGAIVAGRREPQGHRYLRCIAGRLDSAPKHRRDQAQRRGGMPVTALHTGTILSLGLGLVPTRAHPGSHLPQCSSTRKKPIAANVSRVTAARGDRDARKAMAQTARAAASAKVIPWMAVITVNSRTAVS